MCFSMEWIEHILILAVVVIAVVAIIKILIALVLPQLGWVGSIIMQVLNIVMWAVIAIFVIIFCFDMISCLINMSGGLNLHAR
jgi:hypothetical protein